MLVGWRMGEDLETLAQLPDGELTVNVLTGEATHSSCGEFSLWVAREIQAWFNHRLEISGIPTSEIYAALVTAKINTGRIATNRKKMVSFNFNVESRIETSSTLYSGKLEETHQWHQRADL
jgi:hypothetical protein